MSRRHLFAAAAALFVAVQADAAHERFHQDAASPKSGFMAARDPTYAKECGACHFAYSPGLMPARSWEHHIDHLDKHFGEAINLPAATRDALRKYLTENAADRSDYEGSQIFLQRLKPEVTPHTMQQVPRFRQAHSTILETINKKTKIKARTLTNCNDCHQVASEGSFANSEVVVPGLTKVR